MKYLEISYINEEQNAIYYTEERQFAADNELLQDLEKEFGKFVGHVYIDRENNRAVPIGWTFERVERYEDTNEPFTRRVWIIVRERIVTDLDIRDFGFAAKEPDGENV